MPKQLKLQLFLCLLCAWAVRSQEASGTGSGSGSGSYLSSGSGMADPCDELQCVNGMCQPKVVGEGVECVCDKGYELQSDGVTCSKCPPGKYGTNCMDECSCNVDKGNNCDHITGDCMCTGCFSGDDCLATEGPECVIAYLESSPESKDEHLNMFGAPPSFPSDSGNDVMSYASNILEVDISVIESASFGTDDRTGIGGRFLLIIEVEMSSKQTASIEEHVKTGEFRCTLIIVESDTTLVTLNI